MSCQSIIFILQKIVSSLEERRAELNRLDANIGDGDHGRTITNAFKNTLEQMKSFEEKDIGSALKKMGKILAFSTGAAAGPLFGSAFMEAGKRVEGKEELTLKDWRDALMGAVEGIKKRGKAEVGEKTMLDTIYPAAQALKRSVENNDSLKQGLSEALQAARQGMESTKDLISKRGRSSRLGERTKGYIDPGAASSYYILEAIITSCLEKK